MGDCRTSDVELWNDLSTQFESIRESVTVRDWMLLHTAGYFLFSKLGMHSLALQELEAKIALEVVAHPKRHYDLVVSLFNYSLFIANCDEKGISYLREMLSNETLSRRQAQLRASLCEELLRLRPDLAIPDDLLLAMESELRKHGIQRMV